MILKKLPRVIFCRSSSAIQLSSLSGSAPARRPLTSSSSSFFAISSLPLHAPKLSDALKRSVGKPSSSSSSSSSSSIPKPPSLASSRLLKLQSNLSDSKLNLPSDLHRQRYPYLAEIKISCFLPPSSTSSTSTLTTSLLPSLTALHAPHSPRFPLVPSRSLLLLPPTLSESISGLFTFVRRTNALYDHVQRFWVPDAKGEKDTLLGTTLVVLEAEQMLTLVVKGKGKGFVEMVENVKEFTRVGEGQLANGESAKEDPRGGRVICVVLGWSCWEGRDRVDRKWREKVVGDLVVKGGCFVHDVATVEEATSFLWTTFGNIAVRKHALLDPSTPTPPPPPIKVRRSFAKVARKGFNSLDTFSLMHHKISRGSPDKSRAIVAEFPSLRKLLERYDDAEGRGKGDGQGALKDLYPRGENGEPQSKKIGPAFSNKVHRIWTSEDPQEVV